MPAAVAYDLKSFQKGIAALVENLGCRTCFSGADCTFRTERDYVISDKVDVSPAARASSPDPDGDPALSGLNVTVSLAKEIRFDVNRVQAAVEKVVGQLGCGTCCSGFDIAFRDEIQFLAVTRELNVQTFG
jgi:hypothetical protein